MIDIFFLFFRNIKMNVSLWICCVFMSVELNFRRGFLRGMLVKIVLKRLLFVYIVMIDILGKIEKLGIF